MAAPGLPASFTVAPLRSAVETLDRGGEVVRGAGLFRWAAFAMAMTYLFEGPARYVLMLAHVPTLIYLRDVAALALVAFAVSSWLSGERRLFPLVVAVYVLLLHLLCGVLTLPSLVQPLLGLKVFFTFLFGMAASRAIAERAQLLPGLALAAFIVTVCGVGLDVVIDFPWAGEAYESAIATVQVSREWSSGGIPRLAGFARASFDAATIVLVLIVPLLASRWHVLLRGLLWIAAFATIWLTTSKGALLALAALAVWAVLEGRASTKRLVLPWISVFASLCLALPVTATQFGFGVRRSEVAGWLSSFVERIDFMWPDAINTWLTHGNLLTGRGLGGIGFAQVSGEWWRYNAADNLMIYLLVTFGLFAILYAGGFLLSLRRTFTSGSSQDFFARCVRGWAVVVFSYGCTSNMVEQPLMNMVIGTCFGAVAMVFARRESTSAVTTTQNAVTA
ncbi:MAG: hypothetical protein WDO68_25185 [Gammaproteobacteria bacterium]